MITTSPERRKATQKKYYETHREQERTRKKRYRLENVEKIREYNKTYAPNHVICTKRSRQKYPEKYKARTKVGNDLRLGKLKRPDSCSVCGSSAKLEAHHTDYSKPLELVWTCTPCHKKIHFGA